MSAGGVNFIMRSRETFPHIEPRDGVSAEQLDKAVERVKLLQLKTDFLFLHQ
jgi:hypothetical protein